MSFQHVSSIYHNVCILNIWRIINMHIESFFLHSDLLSRIQKRIYIVCNWRKREGERITNEGCDGDIWGPIGDEMIGDDCMWLEMIVPQWVIKEERERENKNGGMIWYVMRFCDCMWNDCM